MWAVGFIILRRQIALARYGRERRHPVMPQQNFVFNEGSVIGKLLSPQQRPIIILSSKTYPFGKPISVPVISANVKMPMAVLAVSNRKQSNARALSPMCTYYSLTSQCVTAARPWAGPMALLSPMVSLKRKRKILGSYLSTGINVG